MGKKDAFSGDKKAFIDNWAVRREKFYNHWTKDRPANQIQLAFRNHWLVFQELMRGENYQSCLEVGCGRGSISSYFAYNGFDCTLIDYSASVLETARNIFAVNGHKAKFIQGDALDMPFEDNSFDVVVSIGLLEHFQDIQKPLLEQYRVLKPGGMFLGYIVPQQHFNVQYYFNWINKILAFLTGIFEKEKKVSVPKTGIYRSDYNSKYYLSIIQPLRVKDLRTLGFYPLPMISYSPEFPFSLLPYTFEKVLTRIFEVILIMRRALYRQNSWICSEKFGQAFLITFKKEH